MNNIVLLSFGLGLFILSSILVHWYKKFATDNDLVDIPNSRSSHQTITPRGAGVVFVGLWIVALITLYTLNSLSLFALQYFAPAALFIGLLGYWDDIKPLSSKLRLLIQFGIAFFTIILLGNLTSLSIWQETPVYLGWFGVFLVAIGIVWSINLFNFMDGLDGLAGIEAFFVFGLGGFLFWSYEAYEMAWLSWLLVLVVMGFLIWNWPKARVFMGDAGSYFLGLLIALFAIIGSVNYRIPIFLWFILYGIFWFDATITLLRRLWMREKIAMAHRKHAYQRLQQSGLTHREVLYHAILLNTVLGILTLVARFYPLYSSTIFIGTIGILGIVYLAIEKRQPMTRTNS